MKSNGQSLSVTIPFNVLSACEYIGVPAVTQTGTALQFPAQPTNRGGVEGVWGWAGAARGGGGEGGGGGVHPSCYNIKIFACHLLIVSKTC